MAIKYHCRICDAICVVIYCEGKNLYECPNCKRLEHTDVIKKKTK